MSQPRDYKILVLSRAYCCGLGYGIAAIIAVLLLVTRIGLLFSGPPGTSDLSSFAQMLLVILATVAWISQIMLVPACISFGILFSLRLLNLSAFIRLLIVTLIASFIAMILYYGAMPLFDVFSVTGPFFIAAVDFAAVGIAFVATVEFWLRLPWPVRLVMYVAVILLGIRFGFWVIRDVAPHNDQIGLTILFSPSLWVAAFVGTLAAMRELKKYSSQEPTTA